MATAGGWGRCSAAAAAVAVVVLVDPIVAVVAGD
jgi:hypothetical protein